MSLQDNRPIVFPVLPCLNVVANSAIMNVAPVLSSYLPS